MEPVTTVGLGAAALASKDILNKLLGPSADYVGGEIKNLVQKCNLNLGRIFDIMRRKVGDQIEDGGGVNPRVLKSVWEEGRFCEDSLTAEYYGGILASSRNRIARDDRGVALLALVKELSVYQLRFHFMVYLLTNRLFYGHKANLGDGNDCRRLQFFIPIHVYHSAMGFESGENASIILGHCAHGLGRRGLIGQDFRSGDLDEIRKRFPEAFSAGILVSPMLSGAELFLWAVGSPGSSGIELLDVSVSGTVDGVEVPDGAVPVDPDLRK